ncbi:hypothetical protein [Bradyrhizobium sp. 27S5]|uniref:hypothetical protein n=1 Tax=Bradyrhizobium sp. 27S5 TaxID=3139728 RepID=UPI0030CEE687
MNGTVTNAKYGFVRGDDGDEYVLPRNARAESGARLEFDAIDIGSRLLQGAINARRKMKPKFGGHENGS